VEGDSRTGIRKEAKMLWVVINALRGRFCSLILEIRKVKLRIGIGGPLSGARS